MQQDVAKFIATVDLFIVQSKTLIGANSESVRWATGRNSDEAKLVFPLELDGEQPGHTLIVSAFPDSGDLRFHIILMFFDWAVSRLDFENETHLNNFRRPHGLQKFVRGPHWHSWDLNRDTFHSVATPLKLPYATEFTIAHQFDATLRWFCATHSIKIDQHNIVYPLKGKLI